MKHLMLPAVLAGLFAFSSPLQRVCADDTKMPVVIMETNYGTIKIQLNEQKAPITVKNFLQYVDDKFYDGVIFHRVIGKPNSRKDFMIQGGGFLPGMKEKKTRATIKNEADNGLKNDRGTIAMARTPDPHSASAQFFINLADNAFLNHTAKDEDGWGYCVFGKVIEGMDVVDKIKAVKVGNRGGHEAVPEEDVIIKSVRRAK
jgi:peptidyl-prolyl cis-trans isomerase B (cyclophilin B)